MVTPIVLIPTVQEVVVYHIAIRRVAEGRDSDSNFATIIKKDPVPQQKTNRIQKCIIAVSVFPRSSNPFYVVICYIKWVTTSWTYSIIRL